MIRPGVLNPVPIHPVFGFPIAAGFPCPVWPYFTVSENFDTLFSVFLCSVIEKISRESR